MNVNVRSTAGHFYNAGVFNGLKYGPEDVPGWDGDWLGEPQQEPTI